MQNENEAETLDAHVYDDVNFLDYLLVLLNHKKMILGVSAGAFLLSCVVTLLIPNTYTATARILHSPGGNKSFETLLRDSNDLATIAGLSSLAKPEDNFVGLLDSYTVTDAIIERFDLMKVYGESTKIDTHKTLQKNVIISVDDQSGIISVNVSDEDPGRSAAIANAFLDELNKLNLKLNVRTAGKERAFLESRLVVVKNDLSQAEENLKTFQEKNKAILIDDQASAIIMAISELKGELAAREVELGVLLTSQTENNANVKALRKTIEKIKEQLRAMEESRGIDISKDIFIATSDMPELNLQYARVLREFKIQEALLELLTKQFEIAKIEEAKNTTRIQVVDEAVVPDKKSSPKRALIVLIVTFLAGIGAIFAAFFKEYLNHLNTVDLKKWEGVKSMLTVNLRKW